MLIKIPRDGSKTFTLTDYTVKNSAILGAVSPNTWTMVGISTDTPNGTTVNGFSISWSPQFGGPSNTPPLTITITMGISAAPDHYTVILGATDATWCLDDITVEVPCFELNVSSSKTGPGED